MITTSKNTKKSVPFVMPAILFPKLSEVDPDVLKRLTELVHTHSKGL